MSTLKGIIKNGQVVVAGPVNLPEGTQVTISVSDPGITLGIPDDRWPADAQGLSHLLARMERAESLEMTPEEESAVAAWRQKIKEYTLAHQDEEIDGIFP
jgi:hypothetical protein